MTTKTSSDMRYGSDDLGQLWRTWAEVTNPFKPIVFRVEILKVSNSDNSDETPKWEFYGEYDEDGLYRLEYHKEINWIDQVIEV